MNINLSRAERNHPDQHNRSRDRDACNNLALATAQTERNALAWGKLAAAQIARGNYQTAINQLTQALNITMQSQYTGRDFTG